MARKDFSFIPKGSTKNMAPIEIKKLLGGMLIGKPKTQTLICQALSLIPDDLVRKLTQTTWFISTPVNAWAMTFKGSDHPKDHLIFLSDELFTEDKSQIIYTILHEVGHVLLNHRNSIGFEQTQLEIKIQEREADQFARKYLAMV